jgi:hypothetical protein
MSKWLAVSLVGCALAGANGYLLVRVNSLEEKLDASQGRLHQLRNSTQQALNDLTGGVRANDQDIRRKLDFRFGQVESKQRDLERRVEGLEPKGAKKGEGGK